MVTLLIFVYLYLADLKRDFSSLVGSGKPFHRHFDFIDGFVNDRIGLIWTPSFSASWRALEDGLTWNQWWWRLKPMQTIHRTLKFVLQPWNYPHLDGLYWKFDQRVGPRLRWIHLRLLYNKVEFINVPKGQSTSISSNEIRLEALLDCSLSILNVWQHLTCILLVVCFSLNFSPAWGAPLSP